MHMHKFYFPGPIFLGKYLTVLWLLLITSLLYPDSRKANERYETLSQNGKFRVEFVPSSPYEDRGSGVVYRKQKGGWEEIYRLDFYAPSVLISNNGRFLIRFTSWARSEESPAIGFYKDGRELVLYRVSDLVEDEERLDRSVSHLDWKAIYSTNTERYFPLRKKYRLTTVDRYCYIFDIITGEIFKKKYDERAKNDQDNMREFKTRLEKEYQALEGFDYINSRFSGIKYTRATSRVWFEMYERGNDLIDTIIWEVPAIESHPQLDWLDFAASYRNCINIITSSPFISGYMEEFGTNIPYSSVKLHIIDTTYKNDEEFPRLEIHFESSNSQEEVLIKGRTPANGGIQIEGKRLEKIAESFEVE